MPTTASKQNATPKLTTTPGIKEQVSQLAPEQSGVPGLKMEPVIEKEHLGQVERRPQNVFAPKRTAVPVPTVAPKQARGEKEDDEPKPTGPTAVPGLERYVVIEREFLRDIEQHLQKLFGPNRTILPLPTVAPEHSATLLPTGSKKHVVIEREHLEQVKRCLQNHIAQKQSTVPESTTAPKRASPKPTTDVKHIITNVSVYKI